MMKMLYIGAALMGLWALVDLRMSKGGASPAPMPAMPSVTAADLPEGPMLSPVVPMRQDTKSASQATIQREIKAAAKPKNVCPAPRAGESSAVMHFGQPVRLNGANLAWSRDAHYARDVGTDYLDLHAFRDKFAQIAAAGGNSARWWMHTNGTVTPHIAADGRVLGLSAERTNAEVIAQVRAILDAAWAEGVLLNITLFSFDFMCQKDRLGAHAAMLNGQSQSYMDNALAPLVAGLKDHPALLAWEIFNESEGMAVGSDFFADPNLQDCAIGRPQPTWVFQRFVNHAAARIHAIDPNVKVTTSVGHPRHLKDYTNAALNGQPFSRPGGVLDFYQIHWYGEELNPFKKTARSYRLNRPIVVGEYAASSDQSAQQLFKKGYAGAWMWAQTSEPGTVVSNTIKSGQVCAPKVNKSAIEACIRGKNASCYR